MQGVRQVVTQSEKSIVSISEADGSLLWKLPYTTNFNQNCVTPVVMGRSIIFAGLNNGAMAVRPTKRGDEWATEKLWENKQASMYMSTPVVADGILYCFTEKQRGSLFALDPKTGKTLWGGTPRQGDNAALIVLGEKLLVLTTDGRLNVAAFGREGLETSAEYKVAETPTWAHPAVLEGGILIKDFSGLTLWNWR
jgi:outer membrane protein assembly factor BamB